MSKTPDEFYEELIASDDIMANLRRDLLCVNERRDDRNIRLKKEISVIRVEKNKYVAEASKLNLAIRRLQNKILVLADEMRSSGPARMMLNRRIAARRVVLKGRAKRLAVKAFAKERAQEWARKQAIKVKPPQP